MGNSVNRLGPLPVKQKPSGYIIYIGIAITVVFFNLIAVFGLDALLHDDPACYKAVLSGEFPQWMLKYNPVLPYTEWIAWNIMTYSPKLARGLYLLLLMVPVSCWFYYLSHYQFGLSRATAITAAVIPNILPMHWQIPAGINMSYVLWGFLFSLGALILGLHYLEKAPPNDWPRLAGAVLCYLVSTQIMEQALFLYPPLLLAFWAHPGYAKKKSLLMLGFSIIAAARLFQVLLYPRLAAKAIPAGEIMKRIGFYFQWTLPFGDIGIVIPAFVFLGIVLGGFVISRRQTGSGTKRSVNLIYGIFLCWGISTIFVFLVMNQAFSPRYTYMSAFGLEAIFLYSIHAILRRILTPGFKLHIAVFAALILFAGISRYFNLKEIYAQKNTTFSVIQHDLNKTRFPRDSQIVIVGVDGIPGCWERASGYLQYAAKREDVTGLIGPVNSNEYFNFDDHFNLALRNGDWGSRYNMTGLELGKPLFLFYYDDREKKLGQMEYALQWNGAAMGSPWTILQADKISGKISPLVTGTGMPEYQETIERLRKKGIYQSDILWGGPPTKEEQIRLEKGA
jgi:hypothetical protein